MTVKEFFRKIRRNRTWEIRWDDTVRCVDDRCPLGAADDDLKDVPSARGASRLLGLSLQVARRIASGADNPRSRHRSWLLKNLGIEEIN
jgi:hypothetical protein